MTKWYDGYDSMPPDGSAWEIVYGSNRVFQRGSWSFDAIYCRSATVRRDDPRYRSSEIGFRLLDEI